MVSRTASSEEIYRIDYGLPWYTWRHTRPWSFMIWQCHGQLGQRKMNLRDFKAELMMASGVGNCRVAVILANSSVVDDPKVTRFHVI